jgi:hypothetical protein
VDAENREYARLERMVRAGLSLLPVLYAFRALTRLPRVALVADLFHERWFVKRPPRPVA